MLSLWIYWLGTSAFIANIVCSSNGAVPVVQLTPATIVNVALNDTVNFNCTVLTSDSTSDYHIHWTLAYSYRLQQALDYQVNFPSSNDSSTNSSLSTLSYTATELMNASVVTCGIQSEVDGPVLNAISCTVWIQDHLSSVNDLSCDSNGMCSWTPPYNPIGVDILQYNVTVFQNGTAIQEGYTANTSWRFCPSHLDQFGKYKLVVIPINSLDIVGEPASTIGMLKIGSTSLEIQSLTKESPSLFNFQLKIDKHLLICISSIESWVANELSNDMFNASRTLVSMDDEVQIEFHVPENMKWTLHVLVYLGKSLISSANIPTSTYDVQGFSAFNPELGVACFQCTFVVNSDAQGCSVMLENDKMELTAPVVVIWRKSNQILAYNYCIDQVRNGTYRAIVYDLEHSGLLSNKPATVLESFSISDNITETTTTQIPSTAPTTDINEVIDESPDLSLHWLIIVLVVIVLIVILVLTVSLLCAIIRKKKLLVKLANNPVKLISHIQVERRPVDIPAPTTPPVTEPNNEPEVVERIPRRWIKETLV